MVQSRMMLLSSAPSCATNMQTAGFAWKIYKLLKYNFSGKLQKFQVIANINWFRKEKIFTVLEIWALPQWE